MSTAITTSAAIGFAKDFFSYFRAGRAPYLFIGVVCIISMVSAASIEAKFFRFIYIFFPLALVYASLIVLSLNFRAFEAGSSEHDYDEIKEIDDQFKFSRAACLSVGVVALVILYTRRHIFFEDNDLIFWAAYMLCVLHIAIFLVYLVFKNIREDDVGNISVFQIGLFTAVTLFGVVFLASQDRGGGSALSSCSRSISYLHNEDGVESKKNSNTTCSDAYDGDYIQLIISLKSSGNTNIISEQKNFQLSSVKFLFWYLFIIAVFLELFWIRRLKRISIIKLTLDHKR